LFSDVQKAYNLMLKRYVESEIVILGYSMGTGLAAKLTSMNNSRQLILQVPYFSMVDLM
jgi:esterase/lipase